MEAHAAEMVVILTGSIVRITRTETEMRTPGDLAAPLNPHGQAERHFAFQLYPTVRPVRLVNVAPAKSVTRSHSGRGGGRWSGGGRSFNPAPLRADCETSQLRQSIQQPHLTQRLSYGHCSFVLASVGPNHAIKSQQVKVVLLNRLVKVTTIHTAIHRLCELVHLVNVIDDCN